MGPTPAEDLFFQKEDYAVFQDYLQRVCGIALGDNKQYLVANRTRVILEDLGISSLAELVSRIELGPRSGLRERVIDAMTTNETFWFRDNFPFDMLRDVILPRLLIDEKRGSLRIWSAACSSGQEPYSISMIIEEFRARRPGVMQQEPGIIATDISTRVLDAARDAVYDQLTVSRGLSEERRRLFFEQSRTGTFTLRPSILRRVEFRPLNLLDSFATLGSFDIVFCRNVLIYFSADLKCDILRRIRNSMRPGSYLLLGASETMPAGAADLYVAERIKDLSTVYRSR